jgi:acetyl esterase/lipase
VSSTPVRVAYGERTEQFGELWLPASQESPVPVVVLLHGGFWKATYTYELMDDLARTLVSSGVAAWNVEYRRVGAGGDGGGWPATYADATAAMAMVERLPGVDARRVITCGHSAGGHLALWLAMRSRRGGLPQAARLPVPVIAISLAGVVDLLAAAELGLGANATQALLGGGPLDRAEQYRAASLLDGLPFGVPQVLIHGTADDVVPATMSETYAEHAERSGDQIELCLVDGADHMSMIDVASPGWAIAAHHVANALQRT